jgi:hypothetical protein
MKVPLSRGVAEPQPGLPAPIDGFPAAPALPAAPPDGTPPDGTPPDAAPPDGAPPEPPPPSDAPPALVPPPPWDAEAPAVPPLAPPEPEGPSTGPAPAEDDPDPDALAVGDPCAAGGSTLPADMGEETSGEAGLDEPSGPDDGGSTVWLPAVSVAVPDATASFPEPAVSFPQPATHAMQSAKPAAERWGQPFRVHSLTLIPIDIASPE